MKPKFILCVAYLAFVLLFVGCKKDRLNNCEEHTKTPCNIQLSKTNIRITNASRFDICNMVMDPSSGETNYGILTSGETSCYRTFDLAYPIAYIRFEIGDETFIFSPEDYSTEIPLNNGKFTYTIDVLDFNKGTISIEASAD